MSLAFHRRFAHNGFVPAHASNRVGLALQVAINNLRGFVFHARISCLLSKHVKIIIYAYKESIDTFVQGM